jgi:hypothetical protein
LHERAVKSIVTKIRFFVYAICLFVILIVYRFILNDLILTLSLAASGYLFFITPLRVCDTKQGLYGYGVGGIFGLCAGMIGIYLLPSMMLVNIIFAVIAVLGAVFLALRDPMRFRHPPTPAFILSLAIIDETSSWRILILSYTVTMGFMVVMCLIRRKLDKRFLEIGLIQEK